MKLRQKLAAVLAATMVVTAVPVVTMAASTNRVTNVVKVTEDTDLVGTLAPELVVELEDGITSGASFYISLENAEWIEADIEAASTTKFDFEVENDTELKVTAKVAITGTEKVYVPMFTTVDAGEAKAIIEGTKYVTGGTYVFATTQSGSASVKVEDTTTFYTDGEIGKMIITEDVIGALAATEDNDEVEIVVALDSTEFEFDTLPTVTLDRGFGSRTLTRSQMSIDENELTLTIPVSYVNGSTEKGRITIEGATVTTDKKAPETGDLNVQILNDAVSTTAHKVATIAEYGVTLEVKDKKVVEFVAGRQKEVEFTLSENVDSTMANGRKVEFTLDKGYYNVTTTTPIVVTVKNGSSTVETIRITDADDSRLILDADDNVIGVEVVTTATDNTKDKITVKGTIKQNMQSAGDITVKADGRGIGSEVEAVVATAKNSVEVDFKGMNLEVGVKGQKGGTVVITETEAGMLEKGGNIEFHIVKEDGLTFTDEPTVEVKSGDIKLDLDNVKIVDVKNTSDVVTGYKVVVPVTRASREASVIEVTGFEVKVNGSVPKGEYRMDVKGAAIGANGRYRDAAFFTVGTDITEKITTVIQNGATNMSVNGTETAMPAAAYLKAGKLMAPLRAVANAFGFDNNAITYNATTKEILVRDGSSIVKLTIGSDVAYLNGTPVTLAVPAEISADSTYVPVGDLGRLLGLTVEWDNTAKAATFKN